MRYMVVDMEETMSLRFLISLVAYPVLWLVLAGCAHADLRFFSENYPPYNFEEHHKVKGIAADLLREMHLILALPEPEIQVEPWARSFYNAQYINNAVVFSTTRTLEREHLFKWVGPIIDNQIVFLARKDRRIEVPDKYSLRHFMIAAVRLDIGEEVLNRFGVLDEQKAIVSFPEQAARMLALNRVDLWVYSLPPARYIQTIYGLDTEAFEVVFNYGSVGKLYYAFNPAIPDELIQRYQTALQQTMTEIGADGLTTYQRILKRYGSELTTD